MFAMGALATFALFTACGEESVSSNDDNGDVVKYSSGSGEQQENQSSGSTAKSDSSGEEGTPESASSTNTFYSSAKQETVSSEEKLNEASQKVNGTCYPKNPIIEKGEIATWEFSRASGDIFEGIMAPYVWSFKDIDKTLQGNGLNSVNIKYDNPGTYAAELNVDGNGVTCDPLQVQGVPITISSCKAEKASVKVGETITWTVEASSEAAITNYTWTSSIGSVTGNGASATMPTTADMHKKKFSATVAVTNDDKTTQTYACEVVNVIDPEQVDVTIPIAQAADESHSIPSGETLVAQFQTGAHECKIACSIVAGTIMIVNGEEFKPDNEYSTYLSIETVPGCTVPSGGFKFSIQSSSTAYCYVSY